MSDKLEVLGEGRFLRLLSRKSWEFVERPNASGVVVIASINRDGEAVFVEQYREAVRNYVIEWPAGLVGDEAGAEDEALEVAAARELEEETGYRPGRIRVVTEGPSTAGMSDEITVFLVAEELEKVGEGGGVGNENIVVHCVPAERVGAWLAERMAAGKLVDPKVFVGLYFLNRSPHKR